MEVLRHSYANLKKSLIAHGLLLELVSLGPPDYFSAFGLAQLIKSVCF
jgi:hypothetical protein